MTALASGATLEVTTTALDQDGAGVAELGPAPDQRSDQPDHVRLHVAGALPGETVAATVEHVSPHRRAGASHAWARLGRVLRPAPERVEPACAAYGACGGCVMQHLDYPAQVIWKRGLVEQALTGVRGAVPVDDCVPSPRPLGYRNQAKYVCGFVAGRLVLGAYEPRSHRIVDLAGCRVIEPPLDQVAGVVRGLLEEHAVEPFDERRRTGLVRYVVLRANGEGEVLATLVTSRRPWPEAAALAAELRARAPAVVGVVQNVNAASGNVVFGGEDVALAGAERLDERLGGVRVALGPRAFLQLNRQVAALIYDQIRAAVARLGRVGQVADVFAGVGAVAFTLADLVGEVVAIEQNPEAAAAGASAASAAGLAQVRFVTADAGRGLAALDRADVIVLNPPRAGASPAVCAEVLRLAPRLLAYVSCNPASLARDLTALRASGLTLQTLRPFDMLPHTRHVETIAFLTSG
jgi:23S rRNA (uracil-5-)-methyltransferase RumA